MAHTTRRQFLKRSLAAGAALAVPGRLSAASPNDTVRVGFIGCGARAAEHAPVVAAIPGVSIAGLCDPDGMRRDMVQRLYPQAKAVADMRRLFDDPGIDAVFVATPDHWHALAAIWAMEAGKDVYLEKPLAHNFWEGQQIVAAAKKYGRICQVGTQQRSDPMQAEIKRFLHEEKKLGAIQAVRANRFRTRGDIGKRGTPLAIPRPLQ